MCGIAGILCPESDAAPVRARLDAELGRLRDALAHRGPDASGTATAGPGAGLAHTRLAILDLSPSGAQPMWSPTRSHVLAYNGEVYNYTTLRKELEASGERFSGTGDTEVVLRMLAAEGEAALPRFDGMFGLALLDERGESVLLARDRAGQKPLYVARIEGGGFAFASELTPLLGVPGVDTSLDPQGLSHLLSFGFAPAPFTMRRGIRQLEPGTWMRLRAGREPETGRYAPEPGPLEPTLTGDADSLTEPLDEILSRCVAEHLASDVPVGVLLSGGIDSSTVAALAARHTGRVKTFAVVHRDPAYDERKAARAVAEHIGSEHHEIELSEAPLTPEELDTIVDHHGDPFGDSSSLNVLRLTREMKGHVSVALSGDGADEVFAGYPRFAILRYLNALSRIPAPLLRTGSRALAGIGGLRARQAARALRMAASSRGRQQIAYTSMFWPEEQKDVLRPGRLPANPDDELERFLRERGSELEADPVAAAHWLEQRLILPDDMLVKVDRMSMVPAVEIRPPLLAGPVLDFAARLPFAAKHEGRVAKRVLRNYARTLVPSWVVDRPKQGFALPLEDHGGKVFADAFRFAVESESSPLRQVFRPEALASLGKELTRKGEGRDPEDSPFRRVHRKWILTLLSRTLERQGLGA